MTIPTSQMPVTVGAGGGNGNNVYSVLWPNNTTGVLISGAAEQLSGVSLMNDDTTTACTVRLYDKATAPAAGGSDTATLKMRLRVPAASGLVSGKVELTLIPAVQFSSGLGIIVTAGIADNDTVAVTASKVAVNLFYGP